MLENFFKNYKRKEKEETDLGFGTRSYTQYTRFLNKDGSVNVRRTSGRFFYTRDIFHSLITMRPLKFIFIVLAFYFTVNLIFAILYYFIPAESFGNMEAHDDVDRFWHLFFFSTQTLTTVGYGYLYPRSHLAETIASVESMFGLLGFALATGVLYGRFSRPRAAILYSKNMVLAPYRGITGLMFRIANTKQNELIELDAQVVISMRNIKSGQGRIFDQLQLERRTLNFLALNWTVVHPIDENSPIAGMTYDDLIKADAEFLVLIRAINDTNSQTVYSRNSYKANEILWGEKFKTWQPKPGKRGTIMLDLDEIDSTEKVELPVMSAV